MESLKIGKHCMIVVALGLITSCAVYDELNTSEPDYFSAVKPVTAVKIQWKNNSRVQPMLITFIDDTTFAGILNNGHTGRLSKTIINRIWIRTFHDSTSRKGFFIAFGLGAASTHRRFVDGVMLHSLYSNKPYSDSGFGLTTDFKIGHAFTDQLAIYYGNRNVYSNDYHFSNEGNETFQTSYTGLGAIYYQKRTAPSLYVDAMVGLGHSTFFMGSGTSHNQGLGLGVGLGYQFSKRWSAELSFNRMKARPNVYSQIPLHTRTAFSLTVLYSWFKHYR